MSTRQESPGRPLNISEAATTVGMSRKSMARAIERGDIPAVHIGRKVLIPASAIDDVLHGRQPVRPDAASASSSS